MKFLELLAPARNADIGIAAIDCGADAVYIAGPAFGARQAAGNSMEDIRRLTEYAHRFGVRIFLTLNTILFDNELAEAERLLAEAKAAGVDAIIAQDLAVWELTDLPVHASTQCAIRTPEKARLYEGIGASRLVLEREMSLDQIRAIRSSVDCELEFFVHGALCVCYSGQCYMSERIAGRSANRGECIQACRSLYDLVDEDGNVLVRNKALLSLKDYNLKDRLKDLAEAGICSFKIEGRLKNISYVRNVVRAYSLALDELVAANPGKYRRVSFGRSEGGFTPDLAKTFNRGYTQLFLDGKRSGNWSSMDAPKSIGEEVGTVVSIAPMRQNYSNGKRLSEEYVTITVRMKNPDDRLQNGDGFSFLSKGRGEIVGFRGDVCQGNRITCRNVPGLHPGAKLYRNHSSAFEKELNSDLPVRRISVSVDISVIVVPVTTTGSVTEWCRSVTENIGPVTDDSCPVTEKGRSPSQSKRLCKQTYSLKINAVSQDGRSIVLEREAGDSTAENAKRMREMFVAQISKDTGIYSFTLRSLEVETPDGSLPFLPASSLNAIRRDLAAALDKMPCRAITLPTGKTADNPGISNALNTPNNAESPSGCQDRRQDQKPILSKIPDIQEPASDGIHVSYKANIANHVARETYQVLGATQTDEAFEISHLPGTELMRTKYCIRHELGLCPVHRETGRHQGKANFATGSSKLATTTPSGHLYLINNGKRYHLSFDCANCEMVVRVND
uniref:peptidase U32 family protein n=1 Tax=Candidatus Cryptobacteroides bacterium TaxID=3085639 RepID=UPI004028AB57